MTTTTIDPAVENIELIKLRPHVRDTAACKKIERRLFDSEQRYRSLFDRDKEERLRQAQKMEAVGQLAGGVAHDFNNLLTAINGHAEIALRRMDLDAPLRKHLNEIKKAGDLAVSLTRQLMTFSRKQALETSIFNLNGVVSNMQILMRRLIGEDIELVASLEPSLGYVMADASQIETLLMNLVVNARDAVIGGGRITIETANVSLDDSYARKHGLHGAGPYVMLAVSDTGIGMDAATQSRIFEPFFTTKERGKGTGLGLSMVYSGVKQNGGHLSVESELGNGTSFKIYLPQVEQTAVATEPEPAVAEPGTETILLAEDEQMVRKLARHILETSGYTVVEARNGKEALECCKSLTRPPSLLLTDVVMPEMSGPALVEEMMKLYPDIGVLYMSGYNDQLGSYGIATQGSPFLQKPFSPDGLATKVREVLDGEAELVK